MVGYAEWPYRHARITLSSPGDESETFHLLGGAYPAAIEEVVSGELDIAMLNPSALMTMAFKGIGVFEHSLPIRAICVIPSYDQLGFAVTEASGITSLDQIREEQRPLRISTRGSHDPATSLLVDLVLKAHGFSLADIESWGGEVRRDQPLPNHPSRIGAVERGDLDGVFDEAIGQWANRTPEVGLRFLAIGEDRLAELGTRGFRSGVIERNRYPNIPADVNTVDFSGWPIFTRADAPEQLIEAFCSALEARKDRIPWDGGSPNQPPLPLDRMVRDTVEGPLETPFHSTAERFWHKHGYL